MQAAITFVGEHMIPFEPHRFYWVSIKRFSILAPQPDRELMAALLDHGQFHDPYGAPDSTEDQSVHGPYRRDTISITSFARVKTDQAEQHLRAWASNSTGGLEPLPPVTQAGLENELYPLLQTASLYRLLEPGPDAFHDWGSIVGADGGFNEYIAIDTQRTTLSLIVATDD